MTGTSRSVLVAGSGLRKYTVTSSDSPVVMIVVVVVDVDP